MNWLFNTEPGQIVFLAIILLVIDFISKRFLNSVVRRTVRSHNFDSMESEKKREDTVITVVDAMLTGALVIIGALGILAIIHVNIAGLITGAGVIGVVIGIGGQNVIKDFLAGFFILTENQYRVGDIVTLGSVSGLVEKISLRITKLRDLDGSVHVIANGAVTVVTNRSFGWSNVNLDVGVGYNSDIDAVKKIVNQTGHAMAEDDAWRDLIFEPISFLRVDGFADSSITIKVLGRVKPGQQWSVAGEYRHRLKNAFDKHGIEIPFPQRVLHQESTKPKQAHKKS